ncbi:MAG: hypothetical protein ACLUPK_06620 [Veillonella sp.]
MSAAFTGDFMDFAPYLKGDAKYQRAPDMIYSFKNIGKAEITGLQAEVQQKFGKYWSGKLGYTYLHAINKSDPSMPRQLLDKPMHKVLILALLMIILNPVGMAPSGVITISICLIVTP